MTKLQPTLLKDKIVGKFTLKTHINYIFLEPSRIDLDTGDIYNNIRAILTEILNFLLSKWQLYHYPTYTTCAKMITKPHPFQ